MSQFMYNNVISSNLQIFKIHLRDLLKKRDSKYSYLALREINAQILSFKRVASAQEIPAQKAFKRVGIFKQIIKLKIVRF